MDSETICSCCWCFVPDHYGYEESMPLCDTCWLLSGASPQMAKKKEETVDWRKDGF